MRTYVALSDRLKSETGARAPFSFQEIEGLLNRPLPASARRHPAWWANTPSHSHASAWMKPGWRTAQVDLAGEKVMFVREAEKAPEPPEPVASPANSPSAPAPSRGRVFHEGEGDYPARLNTGARFLLRERREEKGLSWEEAMADVLNEAGARRLDRLWAHYDENSFGPVEESAADIIREAREERSRDW